MTQNTELTRVQSKGQRVADFLNANAGKELTLADIASATQVRQGSVASRIRDLRSFGKTITRRHLGNGVHGYTLVASNG